MLPEAERELDLHNDVEHHFAVKKEADVVLSQTELDWVILRPSRLVDGPGVGTVTLDPVVLHGQMTSADAAETLAELLHEPRIGRQGPCAGPGSKGNP